MYLPNCIRLDTISFRYAHYAYVDTEEYLADPLFKEQKIRIKFEDEYGEDDSPYRMIFCKVRKEDEISFLDVIYKLQSQLPMTEVTGL